MTKLSIYLMGQISGKAPETYRWRKKFREEFENDNQFNIIDPCNNYFNRSLLEKAKKLNFTKEHCTIKEACRIQGVDIIVPKDYLYVHISDIGVADLNLYDQNKPLIGTMFELAWYSNYPYKTVIAIHKGKDIYKKHPFIQKAVTTWVTDSQEAVKLIKNYFRGS